MSEDRDEREERERLSDVQYAVTRKKATEPPFSGEYVHNDLTGTYNCVCCGNPLFSSGTKYDSGSGWPSFWAPLDSGQVRTELDTSAGMRREEVACAGCSAHLGHVFEDGPRPTGLRFCINSAALDFAAGDAGGKEIDGA